MKIKRVVDGAEQLLEVPDDYQLQEGESQVTTTPPATQMVDRSILDSYQQQLLAESRRAANLERQLKERDAAPPPPPTPEEEKSFFDSPRSSTQQIVADELKRQVGPINEFVQQMNRTNSIASFKQQMRALPAQFPYVAQVEHYIDQILTNVPQVDVNIMTTAYTQAVGYAFSRNELSAPAAPNPNPNPNPAPPVHPAPVRSSSPPPNNPPRTNGTPSRVLNENEKRIARFNGFTDAEYIAWTEDVAPREVAHVTDDAIKQRGTR